MITGVRGRELWAMMCAMRGHGRVVELGPTTVILVTPDFGQSLQLPVQMEYRCDTCCGHFITPGAAVGGFN